MAKPSTEASYWLSELLTVWFVGTPGTEVIMAGSVVVSVYTSFAPSPPPPPPPLSPPTMIAPTPVCLSVSVPLLTNSSFCWCSNSSNWVCYKQVKFSISDAVCFITDWPLMLLRPAQIKPGNHLPIETVGAGIAQWLEPRRTRDWKVAGSNPSAGTAGEFSSPGSTFWVDSYFGIRSTPVLPQ